MKYQMQSSLYAKIRRLKNNLVRCYPTVWLQNRCMELWRNEKYISTLFSCLNSACVCHLIGVLFWHLTQCISTFKSFSVIEISTYLRFLHSVCIWDELTCCGFFCMVTLSIKWRLNHMQIWLSAEWGIFIKMKWLHYWAPEMCSLVLKVQELNVHALTPDGGKNLHMP